MKTIDHIPPGYNLFKCASGKEYVAPAKSCLFCRHCTDIIYDYTNGPYMFYCNVYDDPEEHFINCDRFRRKKGEK